MLRFKILFAICVLLSGTMALAQQSSTIGNIIWNSTVERSALKTGCFLTYDLDTHKLRCATVRVSAFFDAEAMAINKSHIPTVSCPSDGSPCRTTFDYSPAGAEYVGVDFVMPDRALTPEEATLEIISNNTGDSTKWRSDWCAYSSGEAVCAPAGDNIRDVVVPMTVSGSKLDAVFKLGYCCQTSTLSPGSCLMTGYETTGCTKNSDCTTSAVYDTCNLPAWDVNEHIVMQFTRVYNDSDDGHDYPVYMQGMRLDFKSINGEVK